MIHYVLYNLHNSPKFVEFNVWQEGSRRSGVWFCSLRRHFDGFWMKFADSFVPLVSDLQMAWVITENLQHLYLLVSDIYFNNIYHYLNFSSLSDLPLLLRLPVATSQAGHQTSPLYSINVLHLPQNVNPLSRTYKKPALPKNPHVICNTCYKSRLPFGITTSIILLAWHSGLLCCKQLH